MLYLPVSKKSIDKIIHSESENQAASIINSFSVSEISAILLMQNIPDLDKNDRSSGGFLMWVEKLLSELIKSITSMSKLDIDSFLLQHIKKQKIVEGEALLETNKIRLMSDENVIEKKYLDINGYWNWDYKSIAVPKEFHDNSFYQRHSSTQNEFTHDQNRIINIFLATPAESFDVSGYAGTGKTKLIASLVDTLGSEKVLLLAKNWQQLTSMSQRLNKKVKTKTFGGLANDILRSNLLKSNRRVSIRNHKKIGLDFAKLATIMGYHSLGSLSPNWVAATIVKTVNRFCYSADDEISLDHVKEVKYRLDYNEKLIIRELAKELWETIISPGEKNIEFPIREYHRIKQWALSREPVPDQYSHIFIDESHDLDLPVIQILNRCSQSVLTFGDSYQSLSRTQISNQHGRHIRHKQMTHSVRAGKNTSILYNNILAHHPLKPMGLFEGSKDKTTEIIYYDKFSIPKYYCTILSKKSWNVFNIMQRLANAGSRFYIIERCKSDLTWLIDDAINFYRDDIKPSHVDLVRYKTWEDYVSVQCNTIIEDIHKMFEKGYGTKDFQKSLGKSEKTIAPNAYILGRIEDSKNMEFDNVLLMQDTLRLTNDSKEGKANIINHIYTGISRAKEKLIIPGYTEDWVNEKLAT